MVYPHNKLIPGDWITRPSLLELALTPWPSIHEADATSPLLRQMLVLDVPMAVTGISETGFGL